MQGLTVKIARTVRRHSRAVCEASLQISFSDLAITVLTPAFDRTYDSLFIIRESVELLETEENMRSDRRRKTYHQTK